MLAFFILLFTLSSIGLPGLNGFAGEFLVLIGMFQRAWTAPPALLDYRIMAVAAVFGVVLGAWYMLYLVQRVFFGPVKEPEGPHAGHGVKDLAPREVLALAPLAVFIFWIGLQPEFFLSRMRPALMPLVQRAARALDERDQAEPGALAVDARPQRGGQRGVE